MAQSAACKKCGSRNLRWATLRRNVPIDVLQCQDCATTQVEEDWVAPLLPLVPGRCVNCGDRRENDICVQCGISREEDREVHDELRQIVDPKMTHLQAAREAARVGRRLMALKLSTTAAAEDEDGNGAVARGMRVWLLSAIGEVSSALEDSKAWVEQIPDPPAIAWASLGQQLQHHSFPGAAADAYSKALAKDPNQHPIRALRAKLLVTLQREGQAQQEAIYLFESKADDRTLQVAIEVCESLCDRYEQRHWEPEIAQLLQKAGAYVERSAPLLAHRARMYALEGDDTSARTDLKKARRLSPDLPIYDRVQQQIKPKQPWWRW